jgi:predicted Zn-dependent peptidase
VPIRLDSTGVQPGRTYTLATDADGSQVRRTVLANGVRLISEAVPGVRSVAFGVWVGVGSRDETPARAGASHYLEHLLFKGTRRRDAQQISAALDGVGGELNAFTTKEQTCYYARVLDSDLPLAVDVVMDMVVSSLLRNPDVESERNVILEEIAMHDDEPADAVHDELAAAVWPGASLGRSVLGGADSIRAISRGVIAAHYRRHYRPEQLVVAAAGHLDHARLLRAVRRALERAGLSGEAVPAPIRGAGAPPAFTTAVRVAHRPTEQANLLLAVPGLSSADPRRFALSILNAAFGGGMSSRLFTEIREKRGLAYSVYSFLDHYADTGLFAVYAGCQPGNAEQVLALIRTELRRVAEHGLSREELARAKGQLAGGLVLGLEDTGSRMSRLGKSELVYGELRSLDELLTVIRGVRAADVAELAADLLAARPALAAVGPFADHDFADAVAS